MSKVLYPLAAGPKPTQLVGAYTPGDDTIILVDVSHLPPAPNLITISHDENFVTLKYDSIDDENTISGITYIEGDNTYVFPEMSLALRTINKYDFDAIHENINVEVGDLFEHLEDFDNPHQVTKAQVGLGSVDNTADIDKPVSTATQQALDDKADLVNGKVPESQLPDNIGLELGTTSTTAYYGDKGKIAYLHSQIVSGNPHGVTKSDVGLGNVDNTSDINKPISSATQTALDNIESAFDSHVDDKSNPHEVTKTQVGLSNVDNTSDVDKPISSATQAALDDISGDLTSHEDNVSNPHSVTKAQVGLSNVDNTSDINKPVSTAQATAIGIVQSSVDNHKADKSNPHEVTKTQVGLGSVDNTADIDKPVSTAQSEAIGAVQDNLDDHIADTSNPHSVTKTQVGLGNVDNTSDANKPISTATASALSLKADLVDGKVPNSQLPEGSASVALGITHDEAFYGDWGNEAYLHSKLTSGNPHNVTKTDVGLGNVNNTSDADKPVSTATQTALDSKADLVDGKVPTTQLPEFTTLELGITATTAYYGDKGKVAYDHSQLTSGNPHNVTKSDVGLGNVDNTTDIAKPVSTAQQAAIDGVQTNLDSHVDDVSNPHSVTKAQVGLGNVDNTADSAKPVSTAQKAAIDTVQDNLDSHEANTSNPHSVTQAQVGLGNVNNTSDADKPVSTATQTALDGKADLVNGVVPDDQLPTYSTLALGITATTAYYGDKGKTAYDHSQLTSGNPHNVTKSDVGLGNVDNTADSAKPVSTLQQAAIDAVDGALEDHITDTTNPHSVTKAQVGLGSVDNTADSAKPVSTAQKAAIDAVQDNLDSHVDNTSNPHSVTKSQVGLANVDNTSDVNKPVSTAQAAAIAVVQGNLDDHEGDTSNPHSVTKSQVGLGNVDNTSDANKPISTATQTALNNKADLVDGVVPSSQLPEISTLELGTTATTAYYGDKGQTAYNHSQLTSGNPHNVTKAEIGLGNVDNTSDANKPVSTAQASAIGVVQTNLDNHEDDTSNPHGVTKAQVGLGNVNNTSDADKPVSTLQQAAINGVQGNLTTHVNNTSNPHSVTKAQVGLANVDNTSDASKPISTATQSALDAKADLVNGKVPETQLPDNIGLELGITATTAYYGDKGKTAYDHSQLTSGNPHNVTKSDVGLGNVDNTSDLNKPISTAVQAALDTKMTGSYSSATPSSPTMSGSAGSLDTISRGDHSHPSETFTISGITISTGSWTADSTYALYSYRATITNSSITASHTPIVVYSQVDSSLGIYSQVAETGSGVLYLYASEIPETTTVVDTVVFIKET